MKKYLGFILFALLIIAFSATAYALEFKASGYLRTDTTLYENIAKTAVDAGIYGPVDSDFLPGTKAYNRTNSYLASRARLKFDLVEDKNLKGVIYFEMDSSTWGDKAGDRGRVGFWGTDRAAVEVKHAYMDVGVPYFGIPLPMTIRIGAQGVSVRKDIVIDQDGMGFNIGIKADPVSINPFWFKPYEGNTATADDVDFYGVDVKANIDKISIGGYVLAAAFNSYPIPQTVAKYSDSPVFNYEADFTWFGVYSDGTIGPVKYNFDLAFVDGKVEHTRSLTVKDVDYSGWATIIKLDYPWEKFNFGGTFMYATGADQKKTDGHGLPGKTTPWGTTSTKVKSYVMPPEPGGFETGFVFYDNWALGIEKYGAAKSGKTDGADNSGMVSRADIGGTWMARVYGACKVAPWYKIHVQAMYIGDTTKNGNTVGNARKTPTSTNPRDDGDIGWEVGLLNTINIYKNLTFFAGGGILFAGDALANWNATKSRNEKPDDPWQIATRLVYEF